MATVTFDTLAKAQDRLVTEEILTQCLTSELAPIKADLLVLKWMMAVVIAVNVIPVLTKLLAQ